MKLRLRVKNLDKPEMVAYDRILRRYGSNCYLQSIEDQSDNWKIPIGAYLQSSIVDERTEKEQILNLNFRNVGEVLIRKSTNRVSKATPLRTLGKNITEKRSFIRKIVEQDLVKVIGQPELRIKFGHLKFAFNGLQPLYRTVCRLLLEEYPSFDELLNIGEHYLDQADLLVITGYAEYTEEQPRRLIATNRLKELYCQEKNLEKTVDAIFGIVLSNCYYDLQKGRKIAQFMPYIRASTAYYGDAVQFGKLISVKESHLRESIREYYRGAPVPPRLTYAYPALLRELVDAQILAYDNDFITGRNDIFEQLMDVRSKLPISEINQGFFG